MTGGASRGRVSRVRAASRGRGDVAAAAARLGERVGLEALQPKEVEERLVRRKLGVRRRQELVAVEDGVRAGHEHERLFAGRELEAPCREAHHGLGQDDARGRDHPYHLEDVHRRRLAAVADGRARHRDEGVHRHGLGVPAGQRRELVQQTDAVRGALAQPQDAAGADGDARGLHVGDGLEPVVVGPRGNDGRVELARRVEVVVVRVEPRVLQLPRLNRVQHPERRADLQALGSYALDHFENLAERLLLVAELAPRGAHAEPRRPRELGALRRRQHLVHGQLARRLDVRLVADGLRAVAAVLGAAARFNREERALLHVATVPVRAVRGARVADEFQQRRVEDGANLVPRPVRADRERRRDGGADGRVVCDWRFVAGRRRLRRGLAHARERDRRRRRGVFDVCCG
mmetsp:Transcript_18425/g.56079  ORF Transcript_18425/g.56079 Transcript_18425/m.56079 type:complete len:404 (-) Transcript_18425:208-1419(-)